jgi:hypothetical protein
VKERGQRKGEGETINFRGEREGREIDDPDPEAKDSEAWKVDFKLLDFLFLGVLTTGRLFEKGHIIAR